MSEYPVTSTAGLEMLAAMPGLFGTVLEMRVLVQAEGTAFDQLAADLEDQLKQQFVGTATWDLPVWEKEFGIVPPAGQPVEQRRAVIQSKMRGYGKFSGQLMKSVAEAYDNGEIAVSFTPETSTFTVTFVSTLGEPPNIADLQATVESILPAHLTVAYAYRYLTIDEVDAMTINEMEDHPLSDFAPFLG